MFRLVKCVAILSLFLSVHAAWADAFCGPNGEFNPAENRCYPLQYRSPPRPRKEYWVTTYNAIAIDMTTKRGRTGYSHSEASQQIADQEALELCKLNTCQIVLRYINRCGSIAVSDIDRNIFGSGLGDTPLQAEEAALKDCIDKGGNQCGIWARGRCAGAYGYGNPHYR